MCLIDMDNQGGLGQVGKATKRTLTLAIHVIPPRMHPNLIIGHATHSADLTRVHRVLLRLLLTALQGHFCGLFVAGWRERSPIGFIDFSTTDL